MASFAEQLATFGPNQNSSTAMSLEEARAYCQELAQKHYENFTVASWLLPKHLRSHFFSIYAYCRWSDDLADETESPHQAQELLSWWKEELTACYAGEVRHPVFIALQETIRKFEIPQQPFADLLIAFRQDQQKHRYESVEEVLDYCRYSANPVGRLVLYLGRTTDEESFRLSDSVCTGLQLANFCQDVAQDYQRGRIYLPRENWNDYTEDHFAHQVYTPEFQELMEGEVNRAESCLVAGLPLVARVPRSLQVDIELFIRGGLAILAAIRDVDYDVWQHRPKVSKGRQFRLLFGCWLRRLVRRSR